MDKQSPDHDMDKRNCIQVEKILANLEIVVAVVKLYRQVLQT